jgi:uncharacterized membrane protein
VKNTGVLPNFVVSKDSFLRKKIVAFFIFICVAVNEFAPSAIEISKNSLVLVIILTIHNVVSKIFKQCNNFFQFFSVSLNDLTHNSLTILSNKMTKDLQKFLLSSLKSCGNGCFRKTTSWMLRK